MSESTVDKVTVETIASTHLTTLLESATIRKPFDAGVRDTEWVCAKCGEPCGFLRCRSNGKYDMADAYCFTANCVGGVFCARTAYLCCDLNGRRSDDDRLNRNALVQLATRALAGEHLARMYCARIWNMLHGSGARAESQRAAPSDILITDFHLLDPEAKTLPPLAETLTDEDIQWFYQHGPRTMDHVRYHGWALGDMLSLRLSGRAWIATAITERLLRDESWRIAWGSR